MEEGTSSESPSGGLPNPQNPWERPPTVFSAQNDLEQESSHPQEPAHPEAAPIVYRAPQQELTSDDNTSHGDSKPPIKKILKIGIGIFVVLTILFVLFALVLPKIFKPQVKDVTLTYWGIGESAETMKPVIDEFEQENPHIKVNYIKQDPNDYRERLSVRTANGNGPDIFRYHNTWYPMISDILLPLPSETIEKSVFDETYYNVAKTDLVKKGTIYGIPLETDTLALFINTDLFNQAATDSGSEIPIPDTWQKFIDASTRLTKRDDSGAIQIAGGGIGTFDNVTHAPDIISLLMAQNGVDLNDPSAYADKITDAIRFYTNFASIENNVWDATQDTTLSSFIQGKLAMYFGYAPDYFAIKSQNPNIHMQVVPVPQLVSDNKVNIASYWVEGVSRRTAHPKEALIFMKFLARQSTQEKLYAQESKSREFGEPYSYVSLADKLKGTPAFVFVDQSKNAISTPFISGTSDSGLNTKLNGLLKQAIDGITSQSDEKETIDTFLQGYSEAVGEYSGRKKQ